MGDRNVLRGRHCCGEFAARRTKVRNVRATLRRGRGVNDSCGPFMLVGARSFGRIAAMRLTAARGPKAVGPNIVLCSCRYTSEDRSV